MKDEKTRARFTAAAYTALLTRQFALHEYDEPRSRSIEKEAIILGVEMTSQWKSYVEMQESIEREVFWENHNSEHNERVRKNEGNIYDAFNLCISLRCSSFYWKHLR